MKKIEAIIRPEKLNAVVEKLTEAGYNGLTICDVQGHGRQKGIVEQFRGKEYKLLFIPKVKIEIITTDKQAEGVVEAISSAAYTGDAGDGKIFISKIDDVVRVRTKERGESAI